MAAHFDIALAFDPSARVFDVRLGSDGDLALDLTPLTAMLVSLGVDRRADPDDELPSGRDGTLNAASPSFNERRGFSGDACARDGARTGSRLWLLDRAKQTEITRMAAEDWSREALGWAAALHGRPASIAASWIRRGVLALDLGVDASELTLTRRL